MVFEGPVSAFSQHEYTEMRTAITEALQTGYLGVIQGMGLQVRTVQHGICNVHHVPCMHHTICSAHRSASRAQLAFCFVCSIFGVCMYEQCLGAVLQYKSKALAAVVGE